MHFYIKIDKNDNSRYITTKDISLNAVRVGQAIDMRTTKMRHPVNTIT
jgi:hypothetical protein